jgi:hypothetical protein
MTQQHVSPPAPSSLLPRAAHWQRALGVLVAFVGGVAAALAFTSPLGGSASVPLILYGMVMLAASFTGGVLYRSRWAALVISGALVLGMVVYVALVDARYDLAHPNAGVGLSVGADIEALAIIVVWVGLPAGAIAALGAARRRRSRRS